MYAYIYIYVCMNISVFACFVFPARTAHRRPRDRSETAARTPQMSSGDRLATLMVSGEKRYLGRRIRPELA